MKKVAVARVVDGEEEAKKAVSITAGAREVESEGGGVVRATAEVGRDG